MTKPTRREIAQSWAEDLDPQLHWISAKHKRRFYFNVMQRILEESSIGMMASTIFVFSPRYASGLAKKLKTLALLEPEQ